MTRPATEITTRIITLIEQRYSFKQISEFTHHREEFIHDIATEHDLTVSVMDRIDINFEDNRQPHNHATNPTWLRTNHPLPLRSANS